jgi:large repetitive protein
VTPDTCYEICGDGLYLGQYQCDDGNVVSGDGCSATCAIEPGWGCVLDVNYYCYKSK